MIKGVLGLGCDAGGRAGELEDTERAREVSETTRRTTPKKSNKGKRKRLRKMLAGCNGSDSSSSDAISHQECTSAQRAKKRRKLVSAGAKSAATTNGGVNNNSGENLPADIWAKALAYLPYSDVLQCTVANRAFLRRVAPLVERITVFSSSELKTRPAARFSDVKYLGMPRLLACSAFPTNSRGVSAQHMTMTMMMGMAMKEFQTQTFPNGTCSLWCDSFTRISVQRVHRWAPKV